MRKAMARTLTVFAALMFTAAILGDITSTLNWGESYGCVLGAMLLAFEGLVLQA